MRSARLSAIRSPSARPATSLALRDAADAAHARLGEQDALFSDTFGDLYAGAQTDIAAVRSAVEWARSLRVMVTGADAPLTPAQVKAADGAVPTSQLAAAADAWQRAREALVQAFDADRRADLAAELDDYERRALISSQPFARTPAGRTNGTFTRPAARRWPRTASASPSTSAFPNGCRPGRCPR